MGTNTGTLLSAQFFYKLKTALNITLKEINRMLLERIVE